MSFKMTESVAPNETLYVRNLDEKLPKEDLKMLLYYLFSQYGRVVDVVCMKNDKMRGQAHVAFQDIPSASSALRSLQGFEMNGKPMGVAYAKTKSRKVLELDGVYNFQSAEVQQEMLMQAQRRREEEAAIKQHQDLHQQKQQQQRLSKPEEEEEEDMNMSD